MVLAYILQTNSTANNNNCHLYQWNSVWKRFLEMKIVNEMIFYMPYNLNWTSLWDILEKY